MGKRRVGLFIDDSVEKGLVTDDAARRVTVVITPLPSPFVRFFLLFQHGRKSVPSGYPAPVIAKRLAIGRNKIDVDEENNLPQIFASNLFIFNFFSQ